jgi:predicted DCC family thiol-disulfide oxidoreductase YuxK
MSAGKQQADRHHLMLYDGECGFCSAAVQFVLARDRRAVFHFAALQGAVAARVLESFGGRPADLTTFYLLADYQGGKPALHARATAALVTLQALGWPWSMASAFRVLPRRWLDAAYDVVARHRHHILGAADSCVLPRPEDRARFLDTEGVSS